MICKKCGQDREFYYSYTRRCFSEICKDCIKEKRKKYYLANKDEVKKRVSLYALKNKAKVSEYKINWARNDRELYPIKYQERGKKYRIEHIELRRRELRDYRARIKINGGCHTEKDWELLLKNLGKMCAKCGSLTNIEKDHIKPLSIGGRNSIDNLQPLCRSCNAKKYNKEVNYIPRLLFWRECFVNDLTKFNQNYGN